MDISARGISLIQEFEGFCATPYRCAAGHLTIGYGHVIQPHERFAHLNEEGARQLLYQDAQTAVRAVLRLSTVRLDQNQFDALCSFTYNLGAGALQRSTLRRKLNRCEFVDAADEFLRWTRAGGRIWPGLVRRRRRERQIFLT